MVLKKMVLSKWLELQYHSFIYFYRHKEWTSQDTNVLGLHGACLERITQKTRELPVYQRNLLDPIKRNNLLPTHNTSFHTFPYYCVSNIRSLDGLPRECALSSCISNFKISKMHRDVRTYINPMCFFNELSQKKTSPRWTQYFFLYGDF